MSNFAPYIPSQIGDIVGLTQALNDRITGDAAYSAFVEKTTYNSFVTSVESSLLALAPVATSGAYVDLTGKPALGSAAALNVGEMAGTVAAGDHSHDERYLRADVAASGLGTLNLKSTDDSLELLQLRNSLNNSIFSITPYASNEAIVRVGGIVFMQARSGQWQFLSRPCVFQSGLQFGDTGSISNAGTGGPGTMFLNSRDYNGSAQNGPLVLGATSTTLPYGTKSQANHVVEVARPLIVHRSLSTETPVTVRGATSQIAPLLALQQLSSNSTARDAALIDAAWTNSIDATRSSDLVISTVENTTTKESLRVNAQGISSQSLNLSGLLVSGSNYDLIKFPGNLGKIRTNDPVYGELIFDSRVRFENGASFNNPIVLSYAGLQFTINPNLSFEVNHQTQNNATGALIRSLMSSSTTTKRSAFDIVPSWVSSIDATRIPRVSFACYDYTATRREIVKMETDGASTKLGFHGATAVTKRTLPAAATDAATTMALANALRQALIDLGLAQ